MQTNRSPEPARGPCVSMNRHPRVVGLVVAGVVLAASCLLAAQSVTMDGSRDAAPTVAVQAASAPSPPAIATRPTRPLYPLSESTVFLEMAPMSLRGLFVYDTVLTVTMGVFWLWNLNGLGLLLL